MKPEYIFIGLVMFVLVFVVGYNFFSAEIGEYTTSASDTMFQEPLRNITASTRELEQTMSQQAIGDDISNEDSDSSLGKAAYPTALSVWDLRKIANVIMNSSADILHVPNYIITSFIVILGILITFFFIYWLRGFEPSR